MSGVSHILWLPAVLYFIVGCVSLVQPEIIRALSRLLQRRSFLRAAGITCILLGAFFTAIRRYSQIPVFLSLLGALYIIGGMFYIVCAGIAGRLIDLWTELPTLYYRIYGLLLLGVSGILIYAAG